MSQVKSDSNLNKHQLEILKLFSRDLEEEDLIAIKRLIVQYLAQKASKIADEVWANNKWTQADMEKILNSPQRTPYDPNK
ncbi:MAG: hypothetical protein AAF927_32955 [Bacteroidota bacterium]